MSARRVLGLLLAASVAAGVGGVATAPAAVAATRIEVVASFFPLAEAVKVIGGDRVSVRNLTPPGAEPHDLELTPDDRDAIEDADLVIVLGGGFQPAIEDATDDRDGATLDLIAQLPAADRKHARNDPHLWLDPV
jgi:zinc transport system substrate-binding protein